MTEATYTRQYPSPCTQFYAPVEDAETVCQICLWPRASHTNTHQHELGTNSENCAVCQQDAALAEIVQLADNAILDTVELLWKSKLIPRQDGEEKKDYEMRAIAIVRTVLQTMHERFNEPLSKLLEQNAKEIT